MKRLIIYDVPTEYIVKFTNPSEDILVNANEVHRYCIGGFGCWLKTPAPVSSRTDLRTWVSACRRSRSLS